MNPIETIFGLCDAEPDKKLSLNEILENNAECWNVLEYVGMQKTTITEKFSMIDKDQNGYVSIDEAYDAAKTLDRKKEKPKTHQCHANFRATNPTYVEGKSPKNCAKCLQYTKCKQARNGGQNVICDCKTGKCRVNIVYGGLGLIHFPNVICEENP